MNLNLNATVDVVVDEASSRLDRVAVAESIAGSIFEDGVIMSTSRFTVAFMFTFTSTSTSTSIYEGAVSISPVQYR